MRRSPFLSRINTFLAVQWRVPLAAEHYPDLLAFGALFALWFSLALGAEGGAEPLAAARAARVCGLVLGVHLLVLAWRSRKGFNIQLGVLLFVPCLLWCVMDWLWFSPEPWVAETRFIQNCMVFISFSVALHHFRAPLMKWIAVALLAACITVGSTLAIGLQVHPISWLLSDNVGAAQSQTLSATLGHPVATGAVILLVFFPCLGYALGLRGNNVARLLAIPASVLLFAGLCCTQHVGVLIGLFVGVCIVAFLFTSRWSIRTALVLPMFLAVLLAGGFADSNVGIFRYDSSVAETGTVPVLVRGAWDSFLEKPIQGQGTGGFRYFFERFRPVGWGSAPSAPGGLPFTFFSENGVLGTTLFLVPVFYIWCSVLVACLRLPRHEKPEKTPGMTYRRRLMPEDRLYLASFVAGGTGAVIALVVDYPGPMPAVVCLFAVFGGAALRLTPAAMPQMLSGSGIREPVIRVLAVFLTAGWLAWSRTPFKAEAYSRAAAVALAPLLTAPAGEEGRHVAGMPGLSEAEVRGRLYFAEDNAREAIRLVPGNGNAWNTLASAALRRFPLSPDRGAELSALALQASQNAIQTSEDNFEFHLTRAHALRMAGNNRAALLEFELCYSLAPFNAETALSYANALAWNGGDVSRNARAANILELAQRRHPENPVFSTRLNLLRTAVPPATPAATPSAAPTEAPTAAPAAAHPAAESPSEPVSGFGGSR